jgi:hypothetical protein
MENLRRQPALQATFPNLLGEMEERYRALTGGRTPPGAQRCPPPEEDLAQGERGPGEQGAETPTSPLPRQEGQTPSPVPTTRKLLHSPEGIEKWRQKVARQREELSELRKKHRQETNDLRERLRRMEGDHIGDIENERLLRDDAAERAEHAAGLREAKLLSHQATIDGLAGQQGKLQQEADKLKDTALAADLARQEASEEVLRLEDTLQRLTQKYLDLEYASKMEVEILRKEQATLQAQLDKAPRAPSEERAYLLKELEGLKESCMVMNARLQSLSKQHQQAVEDTEACKQEKQRLHRDLGDLQKQLFEQIQAREREREALTKTLKEKTRLLEQEEGQTRSLRHQLREATDKVELQEDFNRALMISGARDREAMYKSENANKTAKREIGDLTTRLRQLCGHTAENKALTGQLGALQDRMATMEAENEMLRGQKDRAREEQYQALLRQERIPGTKPHLAPLTEQQAHVKWVEGDTLRIKQEKEQAREVGTMPTAATYPVKPEKYGAYRTAAGAGGGDDPGNDGDDDSHSEGGDFRLPPVKPADRPKGLSQFTPDQGESPRLSGGYGAGPSQYGRPSPVAPASQGRGGGLTLGVRPPPGISEGRPAPGGGYDYQAYMRAQREEADLTRGHQQGPSGPPPQDSRMGPPQAVSSPVSPAQADPDQSVALTVATRLGENMMQLHQDSFRIMEQLSKEHQKQRDRVRARPPDAREHLRTIPLYDGKNKEMFTEWISKIERVAREIGDEEQYSPAKLAILKAQGSVYGLLDNLPAGKPWRDIKHDLQKEFSNIPTIAHAVGALAARRQGSTESLEEYTQDFYRLAQTVQGRSPFEVTDPTLIHGFVMGLRNEELQKKASLKLADFKSLHAVGKWCSEKCIRYRVQECTLERVHQADKMAPGVFEVQTRAAGKGDGPRPSPAHQGRRAGGNRPPRPARGPYQRGSAPAGPPPPRPAVATPTTGAGGGDTRSPGVRPMLHTGAPRPAAWTPPAPRGSTMSPPQIRLNPYTPQRNAGQRKYTEETLIDMARRWAEAECFLCHEIGHPKYLCRDEEIKEKMIQIREAHGWASGKKVELTQQVQMTYPVNLDNATRALKRLAVPAPGRPAPNRKFNKKPDAKVSVLYEDLPIETRLGLALDAEAREQELEELRVAEEEEVWRECEDDTPLEEEDYSEMEEDEYYDEYYAESDEADVDVIEVDTIDVLLPEEGHLGQDALDSELEDSDLEIPDLEMEEGDSVPDLVAMSDLSPEVSESESEDDRPSATITDAGALNTDEEGKDERPCRVALELQWENVPTCPDKGEGGQTLPSGPGETARTAGKLCKLSLELTWEGGSTPAGPEEGATQLETELGDLEVEDDPPGPVREPISTWTPHACTPECLQHQEECDDSYDEDGLDDHCICRPEQSPCRFLRNCIQVDMLKVKEGPPTPPVPVPGDPDRLPRPQPLRRQKAIRGRKDLKLNLRTMWDNLTLEDVDTRPPCPPTPTVEYTKEKLWRATLQECTAPGDEHNHPPGPLLSRVEPPSDEVWGGPDSRHSLPRMPSGRIWTPCGPVPESEPHQDKWDPCGPVPGCDLLKPDVWDPCGPAPESSLPPPGQPEVDRWVPSASGPVPAATWAKEYPQTPSTKSGGPEECAIDTLEVEDEAASVDPEQSKEEVAPVDPGPGEGPDAPPGLDETGPGELSEPVEDATQDGGAVPGPGQDTDTKMEDPPVVESVAIPEEDQVPRLRDVVRKEAWLIPRCPYCNEEGTIMSLLPGGRREEMTREYQQVFAKLQKDMGVKSAETLHKLIQEDMATGCLFDQIMGRQLTRLKEFARFSGPLGESLPSEVNPASLPRITRDDVPPKSRVLTVQDQPRRRQKRKSLFPGQLDGVPVQALYDTGADRSCISKFLFDKLARKPPLRKMDLSVVAAGGKPLGMLGEAYFTLKLGRETFSHPFLVLNNLRSAVIIGNDMQQKFRLGQSWKDGRMMISKGSRCVIYSVDTHPRPLRLHAQMKTVVPPHCVAAIAATLDGGVALTDTEGELLHLKPKHLDSLVAIPTVHKTGGVRPKVVPYTVYNPTDQPVTLSKGHTLAMASDTVEVSDLHICTKEVDYALTDEFLEEILVHKATLDSERLPRDPEGSNTMTSPALATSAPKMDIDDYAISDKAGRGLEEMLKEYEDIFSTGPTDIGHAKLITMDIDTGDSPPIAQQPYKVPLKHLEWLQQELNQLERAGVIEECVSQWASPIVIVPKKAAPGLPPQKRLCVDYRALNSLLPPVVNPTTKAKGILTFVPLPRIDDLLGRLCGAKIFTSLDCTQGYHHIALSPEAQLKSAFVTPLGKFKFNKVPFGLAQAPAYFQLLINHITKGFPFVFAYLDDILIYSKNEMEHLAHLKQVFDRLREHDLKLKRRKCDFFKEELQYLGHLLGGSGIRPVPGKVQAIQDMPPPTTTREVRQVLGLAGYYRKFVPHYANVVKPLTRLCRQTPEFEWNPAAEKAFGILKEFMSKAPILSYPDPSRPFVLYTDASKYAWGGCLMQTAISPEDALKATGATPEVLENYKRACPTLAYEKEKLHPITYVSKQFQGSQLNWAALTKEAYAIYRGVLKLQFYIKGVPVVIRTDHLPLEKMLKKNTASEMVNNWALELESYYITIEHVPGVRNALADVLSRLVKEEVTSPAEAEPYGYEFGKYIFDETPEAKKQRLQRDRVEKARKRKLEAKVQAIQTEPVPKEVLDTLRSLEPTGTTPPPE